MTPAAALTNMRDAWRKHVPAASLYEVTPEPYDMACEMVRTAGICRTMSAHSAQIAADQLEDAVRRWLDAR